MIMNPSVKRISLAILVSMLCILSPLSAQAAVEQGPTQSVSRTAVDALGRNVTVSEEIQRILVVGRAAVMPADALFLFPSVNDMEIVLAKTDQGLGDFFNLIRPEFSQSGRLGQQVGAEEIIAHNPDLVLTKSSNYDSVVTLLEPFGIPVFVMDLETPESWKKEIVQLGRLLGDEQTPQRVIEGFEKRESEVDSRIATLSATERPSVLMMQIAASDGVTSFSISPKDWIQSTLTSRAGGQPVWTDTMLAENSWRKVSFEQIASWQPQHIFLISYKAPAQPFLKTMASSVQWQNLHAVQQDTMKAAPADVLNYFQSDSRWILALQWLAAELHPELFPDFSMEDEIRSFYRDFYTIESEMILQTLVEKYRQSVGIE